MYIPYVAITVLGAFMTAMSGLFKVRRHPKVIKTIHEIVGVPMRYMNLLAAFELAGAAGVLLGIWYPPLGVAAGVGLVIYFPGSRRARAVPRRSHGGVAQHERGRGFELQQGRDRLPRPPVCREPQHGVDDEHDTDRNRISL